MKVCLEGRCNGHDFDLCGSDPDSYVTSGLEAAAKVQQFIDTNGPCPTTQAALDVFTGKLNA